MPEVSALTFLHTQGQTTVTEVAASMPDTSHVVVEMWENGAQTLNVEIAAVGLESENAPLSRGVSWAKLNSCLANAGISWAIIAVIGVVCAAACATVVACGSCIAVAAGFTSGTISGCVAKAWV